MYIYGIFSKYTFMFLFMLLFTDICKASTMYCPLGRPDIVHQHEAETSRPGWLREEAGLTLFTTPERGILVRIVGQSPKLLHAGDVDCIDDTHMYTHVFI